MKISKNDVANGTGVRVVFWVSGCEHHCFNCHNPETWDPSAGKPYTQEAMQETLEALAKPHIQGITFSGGDPMAPYNRETVLQMIRRIREELPNKDIWVYTGYLYEQLTEDPIAAEVLKQIDVLVDGPFVQDLYSIRLKWKGSSNQRVINMKATREIGQIVLFA